MRRSHASPPGSRSSRSAPPIASTPRALLAGVVEQRVDGLRQPCERDARAREQGDHRRRRRRARRRARRPRPRASSPSAGSTVSRRAPAKPAQRSASAPSPSSSRTTAPAPASRAASAAITSARSRAEPPATSTALWRWARSHGSSRSTRPSAARPKATPPGLPQRSLVERQRRGGDAHVDAMAAVVRRRRQRQRRRPQLALGELAAVDPQAVAREAGADGVVDGGRQPHRVGRRPALDERDVDAEVEHPVLTRAHVYGRGVALGAREQRRDPVAGGVGGRGADGDRLLQLAADGDAAVVAVVDRDAAQQVEQAAGGGERALRLGALVERADDLDARLAALRRQRAQPPQQEPRHPRAVEQARPQADVGERERELLDPRQRPLERTPVGVAEQARGGARAGEPADALGRRADEQVQRLLEAGRVGRLPLDAGGVLGAASGSARGRARRRRAAAAPARPRRAGGSRRTTAAPRRGRAGRSARRRRRAAPRPARMAAASVLCGVSSSARTIAPSVGRQRAAAVDRADRHVAHGAVGAAAAAGAQPARAAVRRS